MASTDFWWNFQQLPDKDPIQLYGGWSDEEEETYSEELNNEEPRDDQEINIFGHVEVDDGDLVFGAVVIE